MVTECGRRASSDDIVKELCTSKGRRSSEPCAGVASSRRGPCPQETYEVKRAYACVDAGHARRATVTTFPSAVQLQARAAAKREDSVASWPTPERDDMGGDQRIRDLRRKFYVRHPRTCFSVGVKNDPSRSIDSSGRSSSRSRSPPLSRTERSTTSLPATNAPRCHSSSPSASIDGGSVIRSLGVALIIAQAGGIRSRRRPSRRGRDFHARSQTRCQIKRSACPGRGFSPDSSTLASNRRLDRSHETPQARAAPPRPSSPRVEHTRDRSAQSPRTQLSPPVASRR